MCPLNRERDYSCDWSEPLCLVSSRKLCQPTILSPSSSCLYCSKCELCEMPRPLAFTPIELQKCQPKPDFNKPSPPPPPSIPPESNKRPTISLAQKHLKFQNLCEQFDSTCLNEFRPLVTKLYPEISDHDKKILNCMLTKRMDDTIRMEHALLARKCWEREREQRDALVKQQNLEFAETIKDKHEMDKSMRQSRLNALAQQQQCCSTMLKHELSAKRCRSKHRLDKVMYERQVMHTQRQQDRERKQEMNAMSLERQRLNEQIRNGECSAMLEKRITRATLARNHFLNAYRRRLIDENTKQQWIHATNFDEIKQMEKCKMEMLQQRLSDRQHKIDRFESNKMQWTEGQINRARITATLRDIVRKSATPDNMSYRNHMHNLLNEN